MSSKGDLQYIAVIDTSAYDGALDHMVASATDASSQIASESQKINDLLTNIPKVDIDFLQSIDNVEEMKNGIGEAFANIARVIRENRTALTELAQKYNEVTSEANKFANVPSMQKHYQELKQQQAAIREVISARKDAIKEAQSAEQALKKETKALIDSALAKQKNSSSAKSLRQQIKELEAEAALLVKTAQDEGQTLDQTKGRYREIIEELGRLRDIRGDITTAGNVFANDENQIAGVIQGLSGLSGAFTAAQGAIGLFGSENEKLNEIMLKVQSLMAITMGLQQVQQTLNKDSTFSLVTLNAIKKLFGKTTKENAEAISDENDEIADSISETKKDIAMAEASAAVEKTDTAATEANTKATTANTGAQGQQATATRSATTETNVQAAAMNKLTLAQRLAALGAKTLKAALISTGIGALVVLVGSLVEGLMSLFSATDEAAEHQKKLNEIDDEGVKVSVKAAAEIDNYKNRLINFIGTKEEEKRLLKEVNDKYGEELGYAKSRQEAVDILTQKGPAYCKALEAEAAAQAYLNAYVEQYCQLLKVKREAEEGKFDDSWYEFWNWGGKSSEDKRREAVAKEEKYLGELLDTYKKKMLEAQQIRTENDLGGFSDPEAVKVKGGSGGIGSTFDSKKAARDRLRAIEQWQEAVKGYMKQANAEVTQANIDAMEDGMAKEISAMQARTAQSVQAWKQNLLSLARAYQQAAKAYHLAQKGNNEDTWEASAQGKMSVEDFANDILNNPKNIDLRNQYYARLKQITDEGEAQVAAIQQRYRDKYIKDFGTDAQKRELLEREWNVRLQKVMLEAPEMYSTAYSAMEKELQQLDMAQFKLNINWDSVFGNLEEQSLQSLQVSLVRVRQYLKANIETLKADEIKAFQEAIDKMQTEIASRNPFTAMHKSYSDISEAKTEFVAAMQEMKVAQDELTKAQSEYQSALSVKNDAANNVGDYTDEMLALYTAQKELNASEAEYNSLLTERDAIQKRIDSGELKSDCEELVNANDALVASESKRNDALEARNHAYEAVDDKAQADAIVTLISANANLEASETRLTAAKEKNTKAENNTLNARNKVTKSYKTFANNLRAAGEVATDVGKKASNLARVFSGDVADSMEKALDCIDEVLDATAEVISSIGDVGKSVAKGMTQTVDAMGQSVESTAQATATSISTVEKASIILTVISAALQVATAIANLFNNDDKKQKQIEQLQERIDQLQWELDNDDAVRLQQNVGNALETLRSAYSDAREEVLKLHGVMENSTLWSKWITAARNQGEIYATTVEKIADHYAQAAYTADKAFGSERYDKARSNLENLAQQQTLIMQQMDKEASKKDSDSGKIQDYKNKLAEIAEEMTTLINEMLEDIIGSSAEDIAKTLGDAFFDAVQQGEDAMQAWHTKVKEIVRDIMKQLLIQKYLEQPIGEIFDKYKAKWFGSDGRFRGVDNVMNSMDEFSNDLNAVSETFQAIMDTLPDTVKKWFTGDEEREGTSRGIATASQDSVDENNARLTVIQSHTYTLVQGVAELNATGSQVLDRLTRIDSNTKDTVNSLDNVKEDVKRLKNAVENITTQGIRLKS